MTVYRLILPYRRPPEALWGNARGHTRWQSSAKREVREAVMVLAKQAGIPKSTFLDVALVWAPGDRRRRDEDNLAPFLKVLCDGLARGKYTPRKPTTAPRVGLDLVPDDTPRYMRKSARILSPDQCDRVGMWLYVTTTGEAR